MDFDFNSDFNRQYDELSAMYDELDNRPEGQEILTENPDECREGGFATEACLDDWIAENVFAELEYDDLDLEVSDELDRRPQELDMNGRLHWKPSEGTEYGVIDHYTYVIDNQADFGISDDELKDSLAEYFNTTRDMIPVAELEPLAEEQQDCAKTNEMSSFDMFLMEKYRDRAEDQARQRFYDGKIEPDYWND